jgi:hypothetical protein
LLPRLICEALRTLRAIGSNAAHFAYWLNLTALHKGAVKFHKTLCDPRIHEGQIIV